MDPRFLPFQIAAGILLAALIILLIRYGLNVYRNNKATGAAVGVVMFLSGIVLGWTTLLAGFGH